MSKMAIGAGMGADLIRFSCRELSRAVSASILIGASADRVRPFAGRQVIQERSSRRSTTVVDWVPRGVDGEMARAEP
jgi:hypothetical protein